MSQAVLTPSPSFTAGTLDNVFSLQDEIRTLRENIAIIQREVDRRQEQVSAIVQEHVIAGIMHEGPLSILETPGRRSLNLKAFEKEHPEQFKRVAKVKYSTTIADAEKVLSGEEVEAVCTREASSYRIEVMLHEVI